MISPIDNLSTTALLSKQNPTGDNFSPVGNGGVAGGARRAMEKELGRSLVERGNYLGISKVSHKLKS